jgi:hypothetical protein
MLHLRSSPVKTLCAALALCAAACGGPLDGSAGGDDSSEGDVTVDTRTPAARAQYDADAALALHYQARCAKTATGRKRVLISGFGRFLYIQDNATGRMVSALVPAAVYPLTQAPAAGQVDDPAPQISVALSTLDLKGAGKVDICAIVLPVHWDLAAVLVAKEADAFQPDLVVMNGVADDRQDLWLELGAVNRAMASEDGSGTLTPLPPAGQEYAPLVPGATSAERGMGARLSWTPVQTAMKAAVAARAGVVEGGAKFSDLVFGVKRAGFPRSGNTYLCNNVVYTVNWLMAHPGRTVSLLTASAPIAGRINKVPTQIAHDLRAVPRVFVHWPSTLKGAHVKAGAEVMAALLDAQLTTKTAPTTGSNAQAEIAATGGTF